MILNSWKREEWRRCCPSWFTNTKYNRISSIPFWGRWWQRDTGHSIGFGCHCKVPSLTEGHREREEREAQLIVHSLFSATLILIAYNQEMVLWNFENLLYQESFNAYDDVLWKYLRLNVKIGHLPNPPLYNLHKEPRRGRARTLKDSGAFSCFFLGHDPPTSQA